MWFSFFITWEQRKFESLAETRRGLTYNPSNISPHGIRVLRSSNINEDTFVLSDDDVFVCPDAVKIECAKPNDILITAANGSTRLVGKHAIIVGIRENEAVHGGFMLVASSSMPFFLNAAMSAPWYLKFINLFVAGGNGAIGNLNKNDLDNQLLFVPKNAEQEQIGEFFRNFDNLITLHQRKQNWQNSRFLRKISSLILAIAWEQRKLGDIAIEVNRTDANSNAPIMMITANDGFIEQSERYAFNNAGESLKRYIVLQKGELAYNHGASKLRPYGSCFALINQEKARIPFVYHCFSVENHNSEFVSIELNGNDVESQLRRIVSSGARMDGLLNISFQDYASISILLPEKAEQDKIARVFRNLDNLITLHQCKRAAFVSRKSPSIFQFEKWRNTLTWEQRKARELFDSYADKGHPELPVLSATQDAGMVKRDEIGKSVFHDKSNEVGYKRVLPGQFVIHLRSFQGGFAHSNIEGITSPAYTIFGFKPSEKQYDLFWKYIFSSEEFVRRLETVTYGIRDGRSISYDEFLTMGFIVPSYAEQVKIAQGLIITDNLITLHQRGENIYNRRQTW